MLVHRKKQLYHQISFLILNFLAHLYLSGHQEDLLVGNFLADYLKNKDVLRLPRPVQEGIRLHRKIDSFTDQHPAVLDSVRRMRPVHGKFAPVVLDICLDYILANNWDTYADESLVDFTQGVYKVLAANIALMPDFLQERLPLMIADDWLVKYGTENGLRFTFERMKYRTSYPEYFNGAVDNFLRDYELYEREFNIFFPDIIEELKSWDEHTE